MKPEQLADALIRGFAPPLPERHARDIRAAIFEHWSTYREKLVAGLLPEIYRAMALKFDDPPATGAQIIAAAGELADAAISDACRRRYREARAMGTAAEIPGEDGGAP